MAAGNQVLLSYLQDTLRLVLIFAGSQIITQLIYRGDATLAEVVHCRDAVDWGLRQCNQDQEWRISKDVGGAKGHPDRWSGYRKWVGMRQKALALAIFA